MNKIRELRKKIGLTAKMIAELIGTNICSIYNWEQGKTNPRYSVLLERMNALYDLFEKLRKDPDYLLRK